MSPRSHAKLRSSPSERSHASGPGSAASASADRRPTSPCSAGSASRSATGCPPRSSKTPSPPPTCCPAPRRPSSRSSAPGACAGRPERWSGASASSSRACSSSWPSRPSSWPAIRRSGSSERRLVQAPRCRRWPCGQPPASCRRAGSASARRDRPARAGSSTPCSAAAAAATIGPYLVLVLLACGLAEIVIRQRAVPSSLAAARAFVPAVAGHARRSAGSGRSSGLPSRWARSPTAAASSSCPSCSTTPWRTYHFMTAPQFLNAVALGQMTPGPVLQTVAVIGYAAGASAGGLLAAFVAFAPSFLFVLVGGPRFDRLRANGAVQAFLTGAGPAVIGAIAGSAIPLGLSLQHLWQLPLLAGAALALRRPSRRGEQPAPSGHGRRCHSARGHARVGGTPRAGNKHAIRPIRLGQQAMIPGRAAAIKDLRGAAHCRSPGATGRELRPSKAGLVST